MPTACAHGGSCCDLPTAPANPLRRARRRRRRQECAVLGVPDELHGEVVTALVVLKEGAAARMAAAGGDEPAALRAFCAERLPKYKVLWCPAPPRARLRGRTWRGDAHAGRLKHQGPAPPLPPAPHSARQVPGAWRMLDTPLPRNAMGKVNKKELLKRFF
jgi:acyl-CoA synthetase (AMP-forming)/AMP-acid ligase II